jgi:antitoxin ParD1/3/4
MAKRSTMNISLPAQMRRYVEKQVKNGTHKSSSEVVRAGIRLLQRQDGEQKRLVALLNELLQQGVDELDRGEGVPLETARRRLRANLARTRKGE